MEKLGQIYLLKTRAVLKDGTASVDALYAVNAPSAEEARARLPYFLDLSIYRFFSVRSVVKVNGGIHTVYSKTANIDTDVGFVEPDGQTIHRARTNQPPDASSYAVGIAGKVVAENRDHALRKLGRYLSSVGTGAVLASPLKDGVIHSEEIGAGSLVSMTRDVSHWVRAHEVRVSST